MIDNYQHIDAEVSRLVALKSSDNWGAVRNTEKFQLIQRQYKFGTRNCYVPVPELYDNYLDLQSSRSIGVQADDNAEKMAAKIDTSLELEMSDYVRIEELNEISRSSDMAFSLQNLSGRGFVELGFRVPKLMSYYRQKHGSVSSGYDVVRLSLLAAQRLDFDGRFYDFSKCEDALDFGDAYLVVSYHMLEHVSDPLVAVKKIFEAMSPGSYFHVEVPIEPGSPRLQFAHLFPFHPRDLYSMLTDAGFCVLTFSEKTHPGGPDIERYLACKPA